MFTDVDAFCADTADVDECKVAGMFSQVCENKKGGYRCSCHDGYEWDAMDHRCRATRNSCAACFFSLAYIINIFHVRQTKLTGSLVNFQVHEKIVID